MAHKKKVDDIDRDLNAELDEALALGKRLPASVGREIQAAARNTVAKLKLHGGARPGAGRKPSGRVPATMRIMPATRAYLTKQAGGTRGIGAIVDRLVAEKALKKSAVNR